MYFYDDYFAVAVLCLDVNSVELVGCVLLIAFALQDFINCHVFTCQNRYQTLKHGKVCLVA